MTILNRESHINTRRRNGSRGHIVPHGNSGYVTAVDGHKTMQVRAEQDSRTDAIDIDPIDQRREQIAALSFLGEPPIISDDDWRTTIGMFDDSTLIKEISEAGRSIRNKQRDI